MREASEPPADRWAAHVLTSMFAPCSTGVRAPASNEPCGIGCKTLCSLSVPYGAIIA